MGQPAMNPSFRAIVYFGPHPGTWGWAVFTMFSPRRWGQAGSGSNAAQLGTGSTVTVKLQNARA